MDERRTEMSDAAVCKLTRCAGIHIPLLIVFAAIGCSGSNGPTRYDVSGRVHFQGQPVPAGRIVFEPDVAQGNSGPAGYATIQNGVYDTARDGMGVVGGPHVAAITGMDGRPLDEQPDGNPLFPVVRQPVNFPRAKHQHDFDLPAPG
jgi:hypothetical protein